MLRWAKLRSTWCGSSGEENIASFYKQGDGEYIWCVIKPFGDGVYRKTETEDAAKAAAESAFSAWLDRAELAPKGEAVEIKFTQNDWIPGFGAYLAPKDAFKSPAHIQLNIYAALTLAAEGQIPKEEVWRVVMETILHEVGHALEHWCKLEFSEERVDSLMDRYMEALAAAPKPGEAP